MSDFPLVSIICTAYNHEAFIRDALEGFVMQKTNFPFEIIVHDDASTDKTVEIIMEYELKYPEMFFNIYQKFNQYSKGKGDVGKIVFAAARGKYIAMCEGDDYWIDSLKLQKQVDFLEEHKDYGLVWTDVDFYIQSSHIFNKAVFKNKIIPIYDSFIDVLINKAFLAPATWLLRREYLPKGINEYCDGTFPWILDILSETKIKYFDEVTTVYRHAIGSASHHPSSIGRYRRAQGIYRIQKDYLKKYQLSKGIEEAIDLKYYESIYPYVVILDSKKNIETAKAVLQKSVSKSRKLKISLFFSNFFFGIYILKLMYLLRDKFSK
jgi:glycosyltransferase involved in cell wall biosynthesis